jgi:Reverse transcriptase (RNA-dependent DNA polymerase)
VSGPSCGRCGHEPSAWRYRYRHLDILRQIFDFKKAYDSVPFDELMRKLEAVGASEKILQVLKSWNTGRSTTISVNGERSEQIPILKGVPQGDVLSPFLFSVYIEDLLTQLRSHPSLKGVQVLNIERILELVYADDIIVLAETLEQIDIAITIIYEWGLKWGLQLGLGKKKTEFMVIYPDNHPSATAAADLPARSITMKDGVVVRVEATESYRYLGVDLNPNTIYDEDTVPVRLAADVQYRCSKYIKSRALVRCAGVNFKLQVAKTFIVNCGNYEAGFQDPLDAKATSIVEKEHTDIYKYLFQLEGMGVPDAALSFEAGVLPVAASWASQRLGMLIDICHKAGGQRPIDIVARETSLAIFRKDIPFEVKKKLWIWQALEMLQDMERRGIPREMLLPLVVSSSKTMVEKKDDAVAVVRMYAICLQREAEQVALTKSRKSHGLWPHDAPPAKWHEVPPSTPSAAHAHLTGSFYRPLLLAGGKSNATPLSVSGPNCSGNIICRAHIGSHQFETIVAHRLGSRVYLTKNKEAPKKKPEVVAPKGTRKSTRLAAKALQANAHMPSDADAAAGDADELLQDGSATNRWNLARQHHEACLDKIHALYKGVPELEGRLKNSHFFPVFCLACGPGHKDYFYHHLLLCPATQHIRQVVFDLVVEMIYEIVEDLLIEMPWLSIVGRATLDRLLRVDLDSTEGRAVVYFLTATQTWSYSQLDDVVKRWPDGTLSLASLLGILFDEAEIANYKLLHFKTRWAGNAAEIIKLVDTARELNHPLPLRRMFLAQQPSGALPPEQEAPPNNGHEEGADGGSEQ